MSEKEDLGLSGSDDEELRNEYRRIFEGRDGDTGEVEEGGRNDRTDIDGDDNDADSSTDHIRNLVDVPVRDKDAANPVLDSGTENSTAVTPEDAPPASWRKSIGGKWSAVDPEVRQEILKRENDFNNFAEKYRAKADYAERFVKIQDNLLSLREQFGDEVEGLTRLFELSQKCSDDPVGFIQWVAEVNGVDLGSMQLRPQSQYQPANQAYEREIAELRGRFEQMDNEKTLSYVQSFRDTHEYFDDVREIMLQEVQILAKAGEKDVDLESVYKRAIKLSDEVQEKIAAKKAAESVAKSETDHAKMAKARAAKALKVSNAGDSKSHDDGDDDESQEEAMRRILKKHGLNKR